MASVLNSCYLWALLITFVLLMQMNAFDGMKFFLVIVDGKFYFWFRVIPSGSQGFALRDHWLVTEPRSAICKARFCLASFSIALRISLLSLAPLHTQNQEVLQMDTLSCSLPVTHQC